MYLFIEGNIAKLIHGYLTQQINFSLLNRLYVYLLQWHRVYQMVGNINWSVSQLGYIRWLKYRRDIMKYLLLQTEANTVQCGHNFWEILERLFSARGRHNYVWLKAITYKNHKNSRFWSSYAYPLVLIWRVYAKYYPVFLVSLLVPQVPPRFLPSVALNCF